MHDEIPNHTKRRGVQGGTTFENHHSDIIFVILFLSEPSQKLFSSEREIILGRDERRIFELDEILSSII